MFSLADIAKLHGYSNRALILSLKIPLYSLLCTFKPEAVSLFLVSSVKNSIITFQCKSGGLKEHHTSTPLLGSLFRDGVFSGNNNSFQSVCSPMAALHCASCDVTMS